MLIVVLSHLILLDMSWRGWEKKRSGSHGIKTTIHDLLSVSENATCLVKWHTSATLTNDHTLLSIGHIFSKANTHSSYAFCCIIRITPKTKGRRSRTKGEDRSCLTTWMINDARLRRTMRNWLSDIWREKSCQIGFVINDLWCDGNMYIGNDHDDHDNWQWRRVHICRDRWDRRSRKIFVDCVNF